MIAEFPLELTQHVVDTQGCPLWYSSEHARLCAPRAGNTSTKVLNFPSAVPPSYIDESYMDNYKSHGQYPLEISQCSIWGSTSTNGSSWRSVFVFQSLETASTFDKSVRNQVLLQGVTNSLPPRPLSHWLGLVKIVYKIGFNDSRLALRVPMRRIYEIKFKNAAKPKAGWANACLMYIHHIESSQIACGRLRKEASVFPEQGCRAAPHWVQHIVEQSLVLDVELRGVHDRSHGVRKMILEQLDLDQKATATTLTILASLFLPLSLVGTFFGMNAIEINGSKWPVRYYFTSAVPFTFTSAVPFTFITVIVPVIFLPSYYFFIRKCKVYKHLLKISNW
ncbi:hypothetical protein EAE96_004121 [Botrytis aclada]|nr:hypothetical protein EAE96_004121 [Botrytis aclada]